MKRKELQKGMTVAHRRDLCARYVVMDVEPWESARWTIGGPWARPVTRKGRGDNGVALAMVVNIHGQSIKPRPAIEPLGMLIPVDRAEEEHRALQAHLQAEQDAYNKAVNRMGAITRRLQLAGFKCWHSARQQTVTLPADDAEALIARLQDLNSDPS